MGLKPDAKLLEAVPPYWQASAGEIVSAIHSALKERFKTVRVETTRDDDGAVVIEWTIGKKGQAVAGVCFEPGDPKGSGWYTVDLSKAESHDGPFEGNYVVKILNRLGAEDG